VFRIISSRDRAAVAGLLDRRRTRDAALERRVAAIVRAVRTGRDRALLRYARTLDHLDAPLELGREEIVHGASATPADVRNAVAAAARHIRKVARRQVPKPWSVTVTDGVSVQSRVTPLDRVGCYVPGGRYPLPSSLLMTAIPARVAGVTEVIAVCPNPAPVVLAAALEAGVDRFFRIGGAHAIAALAYGTDSVPAVDKIVGPGNAYVAAAKDLVSADCAIDFRAGPSEILVLAATGRPAWIAADLIAQAEHDPDARALLITWRRELAQSVAAEVVRQLPASGPAREALARNGGAIVARDREEAVAIAERLAPEHLVCDTDDLAAEVRSAGAIFIGPFSAQAAGDYATGSNHVLPTGGAARLRGGLSAADFSRVSSVQRLTSAGLRRLAPIVSTLARAEGLEAHARSVEVRLSRADARRVSMESAPVAPASRRNDAPRSGAPERGARGAGAARAVKK
jgi:histidinol dehydrogenase